MTDSHKVWRINVMKPYLMQFRQWRCPAILENIAKLDITVNMIFNNKLTNWSVLPLAQVHLRKKFSYIPSFLLFWKQNKFSSTMAEPLLLKSPTMWRKAQSRLKMHKKILKVLFASFSLQAQCQTQNDIKIYDQLILGKTVNKQCSAQWSVCSQFWIKI